jgi:hypothetical protein
MTLRQYLNQMRRPEYHGINTRAMLKHYGRTGVKRSWRFTMFHLSINAQSSDSKRDMFITARS